MTDAASQQKPVPDYPREVRLGLVLYGGVSLAIYMNGIAVEFFRAVHGRGLYGFLKKVTNSEIVVDIISGTSAGGINGIFLAFALANNVEFGACSDLWRKKGALGKLLHWPGRPLDSAFDGRGFYMEALKSAFNSMLEKKVTVSDDAVPAPPVDLDLFVTGTDFYGDASTKFDDGGHPIDLLEHRCLFKLGHRPDKVGSAFTDLQINPSQEQKQIESLSKLAALTSCFPVAFPPVEIGPDQGDELLRRWGGLQSTKKFFIDGGVLTNKPFTPTIEAIFRRTAQREVDRYLCYVDPDPEALLRETPATPPSAMRAAVDSLSTLPRYQGISADLKAIAVHNNSVEQYRRMIKAARGNPLLKSPSPIYQKARLLSVADRALQGIFRTDGRDPLRDRAAKEAASRMINCFEDNIPQNGVDELLATLDIYYHRRRLFHMSYWIYEKLYTLGEEETSRTMDRTPSQFHEIRSVWRLINERNKVLEIIQDQMERLVSDFDFCWEQLFSTGKNPTESANTLWANVLRLFRHFLDADGLELPDPSSPKALAEFENALAERVVHLKRKPPSNQSLPIRSILEITHEAERGLIEHHPASQVLALCPEYNEFGCLDNLIYPTELVSGLVSKDVIRTFRFSPSDAKVGACGLDRKILGQQFGAFGGFFKEEWRTNDILFGRFDGACQLAQLLLSDCAKARNRSAKQAGDTIAQFIDGKGNFRLDCDPKTFFPHCNPAVLEPAYRAAIAGCWTPSVVAALIEAEHHEIFVAENPNGKELAYGTLKEHLRTEYPVRKETGKSLVRPQSVPVLLKAAATLALVGLGLVLGVSRRR